MFARLVTVIVLREVGSDSRLRELLTILAEIAAIAGFVLEAGGHPS